MYESIDIKLIFYMENIDIYICIYYKLKVRYSKLVYTTL